MIKQICILTKSYKDKGYCVAGVDIENGQFIRLISSEDSDDKIPYWFMDNYSNRIDVLDLVEVDLKKNVQKNCQKENYLIDLKTPLKKIGNISFQELLKIKEYDSVNTIFGNRGKAILPYDAEELEYSLLFIPVTDLKFDLVFDDENNKWLKKDLIFMYKNNVYELAITDPEYKKVEYNNKQYENASIVVSIPSEPYNGWYNKFVAKIFL